MKQTVGVIGIGMIGGTLAIRLAEAGYTVKIANSKDPKNIRAPFTGQKGIEPVWAHEAASDVDLVVLSVPYSAIPDLAASAFSGTEGPAVIDTGNYFPDRDRNLPGFSPEHVDGVWVSETIGRPVYKAFNTIHCFALENGGLPTGSPDRIGLPVAGTAGSTKADVFNLVDAVGFDPVDAGSLEESWRQHMPSPVFLADLPAAAVPDALAAARRERSPFVVTPELRAEQYRLVERWQPSQYLRKLAAEGYGLEGIADEN